MNKPICDKGYNDFFKTLYELLHINEKKKNWWEIVCFDKYFCVVVSMPNENSFFWLIDLSDSTKCAMRTHTAQRYMLCMDGIWPNKRMETVDSGWRHFNDNCVARAACCRRHFMIHVIYIFAFVQWNGTN